MDKVSCLIFLFSCSLSINAQIKVEGVVSQKDDGKAIDGAIITVLSENDDMLGYQVSDNKGHFVIDVLTADSLLRLNVSLLGYSTLSIIIKNENQKLQLQLEPKEIRLKEVSVTSRPIYEKNDTLAYNVYAFRQQQDRTIGDVLKRMPGIEVNESGGIKYKGEAINKFYIEGLDLLDRKYGLATGNLLADAVTTVEVLEDHQPIKMLRDMTSTGQAAINIRLKNNKMNRPVGTSEVELGANKDDLLWLVNLFAMQMDKNRQSMVMYKSNNIGKDISKELEEHTLSMFKEPQINDLLSPQAFGSFALEKNRYLFNKTHLVTVNNLWKLSDEKQAKINVNYLHDDVEEKMEQYSSYYEEESSLNVKELSLTEQKINRLDVAANYINNASTYYLNNQLETKLKWNKVQSNLEESDNAIVQMYNVPQYFISNKLNFAKRSDNKVFTFNSFLRYSTLPQKLSIDLDTINIENKQKIHKSGFYTNNSTDYKLVKNKSEFGAVLSFDFSADNLNSTLYHYIQKDNISNNLRSNSINTTLTPSYVYNNRNGLVLSLNIDLRQSMLWVKNNITSIKSTYSYFHVLPKASFRYQFNPFWQVRSGYRYNKDIGDIHDFMESVVMHNYRLMRKNSGGLAKKRSHSVNTRISYKNPLTALFFNTGFVFIQTKRNLLSEQSFEGIQNISSNIPFYNDMTSWIWETYLGKYVGSLRTNFSINTNFNLMKSERKQQNKLYPLEASTWSIMPSVSTKINEFMNIQYKANFSINTQKIESSNRKKSKSSTNQLSHSLQYYVFINNVTLKVGGEHLYNQIIDDTSVNVFFADFSLKYKYKQFEFGLEWDNIFNQKTYKYTTYNMLDTYIFIYHLRPSQLLASFTMSY